MMPAIKQGDPQVGVDIHLCSVPPTSSPVLLPLPHVAVLFDPFDFVSDLGAKVNVCGMAGATVDTTAICIPMEFPFKPHHPENKEEPNSGSSKYVANGAALFISVLTMSSQTAAMDNAGRLKHKGTPKAILLPTTVSLPIPTNVFVGGPPTISSMGPASKVGF